MKTSSAKLVVFIHNKYYYHNFVEPSWILSLGEKNLLKNKAPPSSNFDFRMELLLFESRSLTMMDKWMNDDLVSALHDYAKQWTLWIKALFNTFFEGWVLLEMMNRYFLLPPSSNCEFDWREMRFKANMKDLRIWMMHSLV